MEKIIFSKNYKQLNIDRLSYDLSKEIINIENIHNNLKKTQKCSECDTNLPIKIKKFKRIDEQVNLSDIDNTFGRCDCGKRHLDIIMTHVLKIMKTEKVKLREYNLRNGPVPLLTPLTNNPHNIYLKNDSLIILHDNLTRDIAEIILEEVSEIKGVLKGNPKDTVGKLDANSEENSYKILKGNDIRCDIIQTPMGKIAINKVQHLSYIEFPNTSESKIVSICNYLKSKNYSKEEISKLKVLDGTCGNGTLGIFLLKLGVKEVVFNDVWKPSTIMTLVNLEANGFKMIKERFNQNKSEKWIEDSLNKVDFRNNIYSNKNNWNNKNNRNNKNNSYNINDNYNINEGYNRNNSRNYNTKSKNRDKNLKIIKNNYENFEISIGKNFRIYNFSLEELYYKLKSYEFNKNSENKEFDICILDCFPQVNTDEIKKIAEKIAVDILVI
ncbi:hypothetical protein SDC9_07487 [bioreactor metagenome]|uniref:Uncharacterized protein n=1 Tax=bioreactor metagenome TaxID=1076179 RepID=A0A644T4N9_9ZZZZ|nr:hypothetical protein [Methanobrevibacter sp.]MEA4956941.1 hypothetical protein [Methanobrevibacter sp.]